MPARSQAQAHKIAVLYRQGKVSRKTLHEFVKGVNVGKLPKHARKKKG